MNISHEAREHGFAVVSGAHDAAALDRLVALIRHHAKRFPFLHPTMRGGAPLSVRVTSFGKWGWWADGHGYRYTPFHPATGERWPTIPEGLDAMVVPYIAAAAEIGGTMAHALCARFALEVDTVLVNWYGADASLGWHVDRTEADKVAPILTMSIGAPALFEIRLGGKVHRVTVRSGDGVVMAGPSRNAEHRIVRLLTPAEAAVDAQGDLFGGAPRPPVHDPLGDGTRMSITWRRTGLAPQR